jgi:hypothetical protein
MALGWLAQLSLLKRRRRLGWIGGPELLEVRFVLHPEEGGWAQLACTVAARNPVYRGCGRRVSSAEKGPVESRQRCMFAWKLIRWER